jgi:multiple sugar transport system permease protein
MLTRRSEARGLLAPMVGFLLVCLGLPTLVNLVYSVSEVSFETLRAPQFAGLANYAAALSDPAFWRAVWFSTRFAVVCATVQCAAGLALAIFLAPLLTARPWTLAVLLAPLMVAPALVGLMYRLALHEFVGPLPYYAWELFGLRPAFLSGGAVFWTLVAIECLQWTPFALLLFHMSYAAIPQDVREAARVDGARGLRLLRHVELPLMAPTLVAAFLIRFVDGFRVFDNVFVLVGAGPGGSTASLSIYVYESFFRQGEIGRAVAASVILFVASFAALWALERAARRRRAA